MEKFRGQINLWFGATTLFNAWFIETKLNGLDPGFFLTSQAIFYTIIMWYIKPLYKWIDKIENSKDISPV